MSEGWKGPLRQVDECRWEIPKGYKDGMLTAGRIYASPEMVPEITADQAPEQVANVACLPGIVGLSMAMPDIHWGYGFPIGGVAAFDSEEGVISPGGVGYDINCGMRLLRSDIGYAEASPRMAALMDALAAFIPAGVGSEGAIKLSRSDLDRVLVKGAAWAVEAGYGWPEDLGRLEEKGALAGADPGKVSGEAKKRGASQLGTLGSGNHFVEVQVVEDVHDEALAKAFGLEKGRVTVMIHTGSRGLGHQVCTDYLRLMDRALPRHQLHLPDRQLACAPLKSEEGRSYYGAMAGAANYAWANRTCLAHGVREVFAQVFGRPARALGLETVYDVAHNMAKFERHAVAGRKGDSRESLLCVHRKGATRAFPAGHPEVVEAYRAVGQPVLLPGNMGTHSYVLVGTETALAETWGSTCHGAGRRLSRSAAKRQIRGSELRRQLQGEGIEIRSESDAGLAEEAPAAYKDVDRVVDAAERAGLSMRVVRLRPLGVLKG
jgi:tRNA-splicing ligase RtcB